MKNKIKEIKPILLSSPYGTADNMEVQLHLPMGYRTCGMVEITLDNGLKGVGEGYIAVFAPLVFQEIVRLTAPWVEGRWLEDHRQIMSDLQVVTGYWSRQGAARHVLSAIDIALYDLLAQIAGKPLFKYLNPDAPDTLDLYASGGDSRNTVGMKRELDEVEQLGIKTLKIRARKEQVDKANLYIRHAHDKGIKIAIDMTQNLLVPGQTVDEAVRFRESLCAQPSFIEEPLGPARLHDYPFLRQRINCPVAGGEIITHPDEMTDYIRRGFYDIAQPDATVIGGISALRDVFEACEKGHDYSLFRNLPESKDIFAEVGESSNKVDIFVHCWGGASGMAANYHAAAAFGGKTVEWPLPRFDLRQQMLAGNWPVVDGRLHIPNLPGLGIQPTDELKASFPFRPHAVYACLPSTNVNFTPFG